MNAPLPILLLASAALMLLSVKRVPEGKAYTVHRFGAYRRTLGAGLHWVLPLIDRIAHRVSLTGRVLTLPAGDPVHGKVWFQVLDAARADPDADHLDEVVHDAVRRALRDARPEGPLNPTVKAAANAELKLHGLVVTRCQLDRAA